MTPEERKQRKNEKSRERRANMTQEERQLEREHKRKYYARNKERPRERRAKMTPEQREAARRYQREYKRRIRRDNMTLDQRERKIEFEWKRYAALTPEQKDRERRANMTPEQRRSDRERWANMTPEQRDFERKRAFERHLMREYGITTSQRNAMLAAQGSCCAICRASEPGTENDWHTDHCHEHGHVRGILCHHCNVMLGHAKDNIATLEAAIRYLTSNRADIARRLV